MACCVLPPPTLRQLQEVVQEAATMRRYKHACVLPLLCSFVADDELWMVMPFMEVCRVGMEAG